MKIRSGFVSNSSSSSFIVAYEPFESYVCECCGSKVNNLYDLVYNREDSYRSTDTELKSRNVDEILNKLNNDIKERSKQIQDIQYLNDNDKVSSYSTAGEIRQYTLNIIESLEQQILSIKDYHEKHPTQEIIDIDVSYDDDIVNTVLKSNKRLTILYSDDYTIRGIYNND